MKPSTHSNLIEEIDDILNWYQVRDDELDDINQLERDLEILDVTTDDLISMLPITK